uniref:Uncharacterized protein n=1 Tax=Octopus bimaculoides TaxID=37653 RepID=A0A0L8FZN8_OCTBM
MLIHLFLICHTVNQGVNVFKHVSQCNSILCVYVYRNVCVCLSVYMSVNIHTCVLCTSVFMSLYLCPYSPAYDSICT